MANCYSAAVEPGGHLRAPMREYRAVLSLLSPLRELGILHIPPPGREKEVGIGCVRKGGRSGVVRGAVKLALLESLLFTGDSIHSPQ